MKGRFRVLLLILLLLSGVAVADIEALDTDTTFVQWFWFDESSGTTAYDSANGLDATFTNSDPAFVGNCVVLSRNCIDLDGNDDLEVADHAGLDVSTFTIAAWLNADVIQDAFVIQRSCCYSLRVEADGTVKGGTTGEVDSNFALKANVWYHVVYTYDGTKNRLYFNGSVESENPSAAGVPTGASAMRIGSNNGNGNFWDGRIDDLRLYGRALQPTEIATLYNSTRGNNLTRILDLEGLGGGTPDDMARQSTLNLVWAQDNLTYLEVLQGRNILWNEANQSASRQSAYWTDYNETEAAHLAETLQARNILWNELNQSSARQSLYWADYNETEEANLNKILSSLAATEANLTAVMADMARQSTLLQVWTRTNDTFLELLTVRNVLWAEHNETQALVLANYAEIIQGRNVLWNELNQSASRQSNYWNHFNQTSAAQLAETLQARNILWDQANQSQSRQSAYWAHFNETTADMARQSTLNEFWADFNATLDALQTPPTVTVTATSNFTTTATVTTSVPVQPNTTFINDTRFWEAFVFVGNMTDTSALGHQLLSPKNFTITPPYEMERTRRNATLEISLSFQVNNSATSYAKEWNVRVDNSTVNGCIFKVADPGALGAIGSSHAGGDLHCNLGNITDGPHNMSIWQLTNGGGGANVNASVVSAVIEFTDTVMWPVTQALFIQPVLTPVFITVPTAVNITVFVPVPTPTFITVTEFIGNASAIVEASSMQFGGLETNASWTILFWGALMVWALFQRWVLSAGVALIGILDTFFQESGLDLPIEFLTLLLLFVLSLWVQSLINGWRLKNNKKDEAQA